MQRKPAAQRNVRTEQRRRESEIACPEFEVGDRVQFGRDFGRVAKVLRATGEADIRRDRDGRLIRRGLKSLTYTPSSFELYGCVVSVAGDPEPLTIEGRIHLIQNEWKESERRKRHCFRVPRATAPETSLDPSVTGRLSFGNARGEAG